MCEIARLCLYKKRILVTHVYNFKKTSTLSRIPYLTPDALELDQILRISLFSCLYQYIIIERWSNESN